MRTIFGRILAALTCLMGFYDLWVAWVNRDPLFFALAVLMFSMGYTTASLTRNQ